MNDFARLVPKLLSSTAAVADATLEQWIEVGKVIRVFNEIDGCPSYSLISRIQVLVTDAGLTSDEDFLRAVGGWYE